MTPNKKRYFLIKNDMSRKIIMAKTSLWYKTETKFFMNSFGRV